MNKLKAALQSGAVRGSNTMLIIVLLTFVLALVTVMLGSKSFITYQTAKETQQKTESMHKTIDEWKQKVSIIEQEKLRPVAVNQIDSVNSDILFALQANKLVLNDYQAVYDTDSEKNNYRTFILKVSGQYQDIVKFLMNFKSKDALINILTISMQSRQGFINADLRYRVYTK